MANLIRLDLASKDIVFPGANPNVIIRYIHGPRGQIEIIDSSGWGIGDLKRFAPKVELKLQGISGIRSYELTVAQLSASPSLFATALEGSDNPFQAISTVDLQGLGVTGNTDLEIYALETAVHYMETGRLNTAYYKREFSAPTKSASGHNNFDFQIRCILTAQKLEASRLVEVLILEMSREWLRFPFRTKHFVLATRVNGALDEFLIDWIIQIEYEKDGKVDKAKQYSLVQGYEEASKVLDATEAEIQNDARKAGLVNAKEVTEVVEANNKDTKDGSEDATTVVAEASITDMEGVSNGRTVFQPSASNAATPLPDNAEVVNGLDTTAATETTNEDIVEGFHEQQCHRHSKPCCYYGDYYIMQRNCTETATAPPKCILRRSTRKREARAVFNEDPAVPKRLSKVAKTDDQGTTPRPSTEEIITGGNGPAPAPKTSALEVSAPKAPTRKINTKLTKGTNTK
ncbi:hypothetical protein EPUS_03878 [Endocarpon pusillum Z07020]|uniref:Uncharacterized protein n=1 Tax=Endocarpon pusillum (strain Z07020 / HMAS-L-300199) TaxID=1263415 RepID=U1GP36_ENDPU|nr:uncharacterized protein EPUS_03878 [Endocarpon pusillum Z07020]ERF74063.1 hypothetical protein EPUS_03878 [Endocarpon pusillum Z07020]